jgi:hypothetical protein
MAKSLETYEDCMKDRFYGSLMRILQVAPLHNKLYIKGLTTGELRSLLTRGYSIQKGRVASLKHLRDFIAHDHPEIHLDKETKNSRQNFQSKLNHLKDKFIKKINNHWTLINKYKLAFMKKWHIDRISDCSLDCIIPVPKMTFYFPNNAIKLYDQVITRDDLYTLDKISKDIHEKFGEIQKVFWEIGKRKGVKLVFEIIEHLECEHEMKFLIASNIVAKESLINMAHKVLIHEKKPFMTSEFLNDLFTCQLWGEKIWNDFLKYAILKLIGKEFQKTKKELNQLLLKYEKEQYNGMTYQRIAGYLPLLISQSMLNSQDFIPVCEQPHLFLADRGTGFTEKEINLLRDVKTLKDFNNAAEKIKKLSEERIDLGKVKKEIKERENAHEYIFDEFYYDFFGDKKRDELAYCLKKKENIFRDSNFLDGFEEQLKKFYLTKDMIYSEMDKWGNLFEALSLSFN